MKACSLMPFGDRIYRHIQKSFGRLKANPMMRLSTQTDMLRWIIDMGGNVEGETIFEVGTGHCPIAPIGFFLSGAEKVITVDLNRRLDFEILKQSLYWMSENKDQISNLYNDIVRKSEIAERMLMLERLKDHPKDFLDEAKIKYLAPADAGSTSLEDSIVGYHISATVFEHIPRREIMRILCETKRIIKRNGIAIHFIDLSDHFQHQDSRLLRINFLRYSEKQWDSIAGNEFAFCNRLRASDYYKLFERSGFELCRKMVQQDLVALDAKRSGFEVDQKFFDYEDTDLCITELKVALRTKEKETSMV